MLITPLKNLKIKATNRTKKLLRPFTTIRVLSDIIEKASTNKKELKNILNNGQWLASYIPFIKNKTGKKWCIPKARRRTVVQSQPSFAYLNAQ